MKSLYAQFAVELIGKLGPAMFSATLVGCILSNRFELIHAILLLVAISCISIAFIATHRKPT